MDKADITKLVPTLSTKERIKLLISDWLKGLNGKSLLSMIEKNALMSFTEAEDFRQYEYFIGIYKWCGLLLWCDEIEKTFLYIAFGVQKINKLNDLQITIIQFLENKIKTLFEYRAAVETLEKELDLPLFDEITYSKIRSYWSWTENFVEKHNEFIESLETKDLEKDGLRVILENKENYLLKCLEPDKGVVTQMIADVKELVNSEIGLDEYVVNKVVENAHR
ncbi:MAG: hypothetical protein G01um101429_1043 [Parcubacteria group bacterium Gr01-1014_29]|nr:MAG: hypothetical protein G01um101429_1043 [Parcubacteria group bacterium Gr01-1014_29]